MFVMVDAELQILHFFGIFISLHLFHTVICILNLFEISTGKAGHVIF
jgi:hypothetical protein